MDEPIKEAFKQGYRRDGYRFPVDILDRQQVKKAQADLAMLQDSLNDGIGSIHHQINYPHLLAPFAADLVRHPKILDHVETLIGPDILVWGATFFLKPPNSKNFVSWHQDLKYWGLNDEEGQVSAWLALGPVTQDNGCMTVVPESHTWPMLEHEDKESDDNILSRGQEAQFDEASATLVPVELKAGQCSFHHGRTLHASGPNHTNQPRLGMAINYIAASNFQKKADKDYAMLVRGKNTHGHFLPATPADHLMSEAALAMHDTVMRHHESIFYN